MMTSKKLVNNKSGISNLSHGLLHVEVTWPTVFSAESLPCETTLTDLDVWKKSRLIRLLCSSQEEPQALTACFPLARTSLSSNRESRPLRERWLSSPMVSWTRSRWDWSTRQLLYFTWIHKFAHTSPCFCVYSLLRTATAPTEQHRPVCGARQPLDWHVHLDGEDGTRHGQQKVLHGKRNVRHVCPPLFETVFSSLILTSRLFKFPWAKPSVTGCILF